MALSHFVAELRWRGMIQDSTPGLEDWLAEAPRTAYIGFDPTATSLHIGSLATIQLLIHLARAGHTAVALVGGATGMIGDPSGKAAERSLLNAEQIEHNVQAVGTQLNAVFTRAGLPEVEVVNNADWFKPMSVIDFLRDVGKTLTVNYMQAKDSVKSRMDTGISFTEFSYQLLQGYDFVHLRRSHNCTLQMGGADQWGNITSGIEMIRRLDQAQAEALTTPLVTKADGTKFGKTEGGNIWLDPTQTSPFRFYQFWVNVADADVSRYLRVFTFLTQAEIETLEATHAEAPHLRQAQLTLAEEVTRNLHGAEALAQAQKSTALLFGQGTWADWQAMPEAALLEILEGVPTYDLHLLAGAETDVTTAVSEGTQAQFFKSKGEARKLMAQGGLSLNGAKVSGTEPLSSFQPLHGKYLLAQKGKKNFVLLRVA